MPETPRSSSQLTRRLAQGLLPVAGIFGIVWLSKIPRGQNPLLHFATLIACGICLRVGWRWLQSTLVTRWIGLCLAAYVIAGLALLGFGIAVSPLPFFFLLLPMAVFDLFVRQPWKGRFARARAERRGFPE